MGECYCIQVSFVFSSKVIMCMVMFEEWGVSKVATHPR